MEKSIIVYKPKLSRLVPTLMAPITVAAGLLLLGNAIDEDLVVGILFFVFAALVPCALVIGNRVVVDDGNRAVSGYIFGMKTIELTARSVREIHDGHLFPIIPGGGGVGRGIVVRANYKGKLRTLRMGIGLYGEAAVNHVRRVLKG